MKLRLAWAASPPPHPANFGHLWRLEEDGTADPVCRQWHIRHQPTAYLRPLQKHRCAKCMRWERDNRPHQDEEA